MIDYIHRKDIKNLVKGAEDTSSPSEDECFEDYKARRTGITTSMERSIKRLLRATVKEKKDDDEDIVDHEGKIMFDRRRFDLDMYLDILRCMHNIEFKPNEKK